MEERDKIITITIVVLEYGFNSVNIVNFQKYEF